MFEAIWIAGSRDGEVIKTFDYELQAVDFAEKFWNEHAEEFDPMCGGMAVYDVENREFVW